MLGLNEEDINRSKELGALLGKAKFNLDIQEVVQLYKCLAWLSTLPKKLSDHAFEVKNISVPAPEAVPSPVIEKAKKGK